MKTSPIELQCSPQWLEGKEGPHIKGKPRILSEKAIVVLESGHAQHFHKPQTCGYMSLARKGVL